MGRINREHKDRLFCFLFGGEVNRTWTLELYNAVNGSHHTDPREIEITTIQKTLYMGMHNDLSFVISDEMSLYEQQSTYNPNMPLRMLQHLGSLYEKYIQKNDLDKYRSTLIRLPAPRLVVFYNGVSEKTDETLLHLKDSYDHPEKSDVEVTVRMININAGHSKKIMDACKPLAEYAWLIERIRINMKGTEKKGKEAPEYAVDKAISEMPETFLIRRLLLENKAEVKDMLLTEYDEVTHMRHVREEGKEEQRLKDEEEFAARMVETIKNVMESLSLSPEEVMEAMKIPESDRDKYLAEIHSTAG